MAIELKSADDLARMREAGLIVYEVLIELEKLAQPGVSLEELDAAAERETRKRGAVTAFKDLYGFPKHICISVNEQVVHGVPGKRKLKEGDLCKLDFGVIKRGFYGDSARTVCVGKVSDENKLLCERTKAALEAGIQAVAPGNRISDIGAAIEATLQPFPYGIVREYSGHGIGKKLHEEPKVPNYGPATWSPQQKNPRLREGMVLAVEPMVNLGTWKVKMLGDGWTIVTEDGRWSSHWEHTIAVTPHGPQVLTRP
ncbi:MAG: type I methionyl aminopeptidase [Deltaproteobacteria bacterium]|nr:type I methionyl aminopeptidase [Deltaproteobacteria bacterium]